MVEPEVGPEEEPFGPLSRAREFEEIMEQRMGGTTDVDCDMLLGAIATLLDEVVTRNEAEMAEEEAGTSGRTSIFHGLRPPVISLHRYLGRIFKYAGCSPACYVFAFVYMDRVLQGDPTFRVCSRSVHRLLITCVLVAAKFVDDNFFNNAYYAKVGGISTEEINTLELETLNRIDWRLFVSPDDFEHTMNFILPASQSQISSARTAAAAAEVPATASSAKEQAAQAQPEPAPRCCSPRECSSARSAQASPEPDCPVADVGPTTPTNSETPRRNEKLPLPGKRRRSSTRASGERKQVPTRCLRVRLSPKASAAHFKVHCPAAALRGRRGRLSAARHPFVGIEMAWEALSLSASPRSSLTASPPQQQSPPPAQPAAAAAAAVSTAFVFAFAAREHAPPPAPHPAEDDETAASSDGECGCCCDDDAGEVSLRDSPCLRSSFVMPQQSEQHRAASTALQQLAGLSLAPPPPTSAPEPLVRPTRFSDLSALSEAGAAGQQALPEWRAQRASHFLCPSPPMEVATPASPAPLAKPKAAEPRASPSTFAQDGELPARLARVCNARPASPPSLGQGGGASASSSAAAAAADPLQRLRSDARAMRETGRSFDDPAVQLLAAQALHRVRSARPAAAPQEAQQLAPVEPGADLAAALSTELAQLAGDVTGSRENHELLMLVIDLLAIARCLAEAAPVRAAAAAAATATAAAATAGQAWASAAPSAHAGGSLPVAAC